MILNSFIEIIKEESTKNIKIKNFGTFYKKTQKSWQKSKNNEFVYNKTIY